MTHNSSHPHQSCRCFDGHIQNVNNWDNQRNKRYLIHCYMPCLLCNRLSQNNQLDYEHMLSSIGVTFLFNLWILCSKCIHKWNHVCRLVKTLLMQCHIHFLLHVKNPISLFIHFFTNRKIKVSFWLSDLKYKFCFLCK